MQPWLIGLAALALVSVVKADTDGIVHAIDPDGVFLELVGDLTPRPVPPQPEHCPPLEIRYRQ